MTTQQAAFDLLEFKADEEARGLFAAIVSVFGNKDRNGDRMIRGAFTKTLERWRASGKPIPVIWTHEKNDPTSYIGSIDPNDVKETDQGLVVAGKLDIETNTRARQVWELLKDGRVGQWSFSFATIGERIAKDLARELTEVDLFEVGPTLVGANELTSTLSVKSVEEGPSIPAEDAAAFAATIERFEGTVDKMLEAKIGRVVSVKTESAIRSALAHLQGILDQLAAEDVPDPEKSDEPATTATDAVETAEADEPLHDPNGFLDVRGRSELAALDLFLAERGK
jgi:HK97 family phage prohead protease